MPSRMGGHILLKNILAVDGEDSRYITVYIQNGYIDTVFKAESFNDSDLKESLSLNPCGEPLITFDLAGFENLALLPAFVEPHAHLRDPGYTYKESLESGLLAAASGGYASTVCMANTLPVLDNIALASALSKRAETLGLAELFPVLSISKNMEGKDISHLKNLSREDALVANIRLLSEDGKDIASDKIFTEALREAARLGFPVSCHCDWGGEKAEAEKNAGEPRSVWSRTEENLATERAIALAEKLVQEENLKTLHLHIAHISTIEALEFLRAAKKRRGKLILSGEVTPMHLILTEERAEALGGESHGRVNPPLRKEADRLALIEGLVDGTIDMIATDHAPHSWEDKEGGAPGFVGFETAFAALKTHLVDTNIISLNRLSELLSAAPARLLGLEGRGYIREGMRADLVLVDLAKKWKVEPEFFRSKGRNSPFAQMELNAKVICTWRNGRVIWQGLP